MRTVFLIPLAFTTAVMTGCGAEVSSVSGREGTTSRGVAQPERNLTLQMPQVSAGEVVSAVELSRPEPAPAPARTHRIRPKPKPAPSPKAEAEREPAARRPAEVLTPPAVALTEASASAEPAPAEDAAAAGRELAPGKTVTIIPVSSGPSVEADAGDAWVPSGQSRGILVGGGGRCPRRGGVRGIGIAARFPVGVPAPDLR
jgi:hypothetical protein